MALPYFPVENAPFKMNMGLKPLKKGDWIEVDDNYETETKLRRELLTEQQDKVFASTAMARSAEEEVLAQVLNTLKSRYPHIKTNTTFKGQNPMLFAGSLVQEDLVIMQETDDGYILSSAVVCFPSAWNLAEKVGKNMRDIHLPVPGLNDQIGNSIDLFFRNMKQDKIVERFNWGLYDSKDLYQPGWLRASQEREELTIDNIGEKIFFRVEKQTLQRLAGKTDTLFTIRIFNTSLSEVVSHPGHAQQLLEAIETMPTDFSQYKSIEPYRGLLIEFLKQT